MPSANQHTVIPAPLRGVRPDLSRYVIPRDALYDSKNLIEKDGVLVARPGLTPAMVPLGETPILFVNVGDEAQRYTVAMTPTELKLFNENTSSWDSLNPVDTNLTGAYPLGVSTAFETGGNRYVLFANGSDDIITWKIGDPEFTFTSAGGVKPVDLATVADRLAAVQGDKVHFSDVMDFTSGWGSFIIRFADTDGDVVSIRQHGRISALVYKESAVYRLIPQLSIEAPFRAEALELNVPGPVNNRSIVTMPDGAQIYLGVDGNLHICDGSTIREIVPQAGVYLRQHAEMKRLDRSFMWYDTLHDRLWVFYPSQGDIVQKALVIRNGAVWPQEFSAGLACAAVTHVIVPMTIGELPLIGEIEQPIGDLVSERDSFVVATRGNGDFYDLYDETMSTQEYVDVMFETGVMPLAGVGGTVTIHEIEHMVMLDEAATITVSVGLADFGQDPSEYQNATIRLPDYRRPVTQHRATASAFSVRVEATVRGQFGYQAMDISWSRRGRR